MRLFLLSYFTLYTLTCIVLPTVQVWRRTGVNPIVFKKTDSVYDYIGRAMTWMVFVLALVLFVFCCAPAFYVYLGPLVFLEHNVIKIISIVVMIISWLTIVIAQQTMKNSWRIGIDHARKTELVGKGIFRYSRNPIFLGILLTLLGLFFLIPNAVTLVVLTCGYFLIQIQVRLEENHLKNLHGSAYDLYRSKVRRWF